jgi:ATP-binding cassette subfamily B protein
MNKGLKHSLGFLKYLLPYRKKQLAVLFLSGLSALLSLVNPYIGKLMVDKAIINKDLHIFILLALVGTAVFILDGLFKAAADFIGKGIYLKVRWDLNRKVFSHLQRLPWDFFQAKSTGEHMFKLNYDIDNAADFIVSVPNELVNIFPRLLLTFAIIIYLNWQLAIFSLVLVSVLYPLLYYLTRRRRKVWKELAADSQNIFKRLSEVFSHMYLIKAFSREGREIRVYLGALIRNIKIRLESMKLEVATNFSFSSFGRIILGLITLFGGYQVIRGRLSPGTLTAIMIYLAQLITLQNSFIFFFQRVALGLVSCQRIDEILQQKPWIRERQDAQKIILKDPSIQFEKVSFGYQPQKFVLEDLDFSIKKGMVALVGPSGCGKTTILNLILRLYDPWQGEILIEGRDIKDLDPCSLRGQIGVALQEPFLWNDNVENNIKYAKEDATKEEIMGVAELAGVDEFIRALPQGYDTIIGENACKISEGQKQKIAIARALIKRPKILILDEAMSSMDSLSEEAIIAKIKAMDIPLVIVVSHRFSTIMACDLAYFLKSPNVLVVDKPTQALEKDRTFYNLFSAQIKEIAQKEAMPLI